MKPAKPAAKIKRHPRRSPFGWAARANADRIWQRKPPAWAQASWAKCAATAA